MTFQIFGSKLITYRLKAAKPPADCWQPVFSSPLSSSLPNGCWQPLSNAPSAIINNTTASRAIRTKSDVECHQEPFSFPSGSSESTTPTSARSARVVRVGGWVGCDQKGLSIFIIFGYINEQNVLILNMAWEVVYSFFVRSYDHFKFQSSEN